MSERELIERAANGNRPAFDALYFDYVDRVHRHLVHLVGQDSDVEDLVQLTFVQVYRNLAKYRGDSSFSTWLHRITVNVALGHLRKRRRAESRHVEEDLAGLPGGADLEVEIARRQAAALLHEALDDIKPSKRIVFVLCDVEGYTLKEAGQIVGARLATVAARLRAARAELHRILKRRLARERGSDSMERVS